MKESYSINKAVLIFFISILMAFSFEGHLRAEGIRINEVLASNRTILADEDGEYPDWVEIYNPTSVAVNLENWTLTNNRKKLEKWKFPSVEINPNEYLIVFLSDKNRKKLKDKLHTNFKLSTDGGYLALIKPDGEKATEFDFSFTYQLSDESFGHFDGQHYIFSNPTPGTANSTSHPYYLLSPKFSMSHGFYSSAFNLVLSSDNPNANIYYTTGGSLPTSSNWTPYNNPIQISSTTVVRAIAVVNGNISSRISTQSYLFVDNIIQQSNNPAGYPVNWGPHTETGVLTPADYEMDPSLVSDNAFATKLKEGLVDIPSVSISTDIGNLFSHERDSVKGGIYIHTGPPVNVSDHGYGFGWERPVSFEYIDPKDSAASFQVNCGIKMHGGFSRKSEILPKHSLRLVFKGEYGPTKLRKSFFGDEGPSSINSLILRAGFVDSWVSTGQVRSNATYIRDTWARDTQIDMGYEACRTKYVHLYINGLYWGLHASTEKIDEHLAETYFNGEKEDFDVIKDFSEVISGNKTAWNEMLALASSGLASDESFQLLQGNNADGSPNPSLPSYLDINNFMDYMLINYYGGANDWDNHNWAAIRNRINPGTGFKFLCWDSEHVLSILERNVLGTNNYDRPTYFFQRLMQNEDFRRLFADRVQMQLFDDGALSQRANTIRWLKRSEEIDKAIVGESARWGDFRRDVTGTGQAIGNELYTREDFWLPGQNYVLSEFLTKRHEIFIDQLRQRNYFPDIDAPEFRIADKKIHTNVRSEGEKLTMRSDRGMIYYTTNGLDPVDWQQTNSYTILVPDTANKKVLVPKSDIGNSWYTQPDFDDAAWSLCTGSPGGIGYDENVDYNNLISLDVGDEMRNGPNPNTSCYIRIPFEVDASFLASMTSLQLNIRSDDGFVAYLNGHKVASSNSPQSLVWNSEANAGLESNSPMKFNLSAYINTLKVGTNILAIHGLNYKTTSSDFLITAELLTSDESTLFLVPDAQAFTSDVPIEDSIHFKARTYYRGNWSPLVEQMFVIPNDYSNLRVTEIAYHPLGEGSVDDDEFEFIELKNIGNATINLSGAHFVKGISYAFPKGSDVMPGEFIVLASNKIYFEQRYGFEPFAEYEGQLSNGGERITALGNLNDTIINFTYGDGNGWPTAADGEGYSLVPIDENPEKDLNDSTKWRASGKQGGSPGENDSIITKPSHVPESLAENNKHSIKNYPNPFSESTYISYQLPTDSKVNIAVYNVVGEHLSTLINQHKKAGRYQIEWNGTDKSNNNLTNGIYYCRIIIDNNTSKQVETIKMVLLK